MKKIILFYFKYLPKRIMSILWALPLKGRVSLRSWLCHCLQRLSRQLTHCQLFFVYLPILLFSSCIKDDVCDTDIKGRIIHGITEEPLPNFQFYTKSKVKVNRETDDKGLFQFCTKNESLLLFDKDVIFGLPSTYFEIEPFFGFLEQEELNDFADIKVYPANFLEIDFQDNAIIEVDSIFLKINISSGAGGRYTVQRAFGEYKKPYLFRLAFSYDSALSIEQKQRLKGQTQFTTETNSYIIHPSIIQKHIIEY